jgi:hypothetical protein
MGKYRVTVEVKAHSVREARAIVGATCNPDSDGSTFEITTFLIRKAGARLIRMGIVGDWDNPSVYQLHDGRMVYLIGNEWKFEGSEGTGFQSLKARLDREVGEREVAKYQAEQAVKDKEKQKDVTALATFMRGAQEIRAGMERAGVDPRFDVREDSVSVTITFNSNTWVTYDRKTHGFSAIASGKNVAGWKGMRDRLKLYGEYED